MPILCNTDCSQFSAKTVHDSNKMQINFQNSWLPVLLRKEYTSQCRLFILLFSYHFSLFCLNFEIDIAELHFDSGRPFTINYCLLFLCLIKVLLNLGRNTRKGSETINCKVITAWLVLLQPSFSAFLSVLHTLTALSSDAIAFYAEEGILSENFNKN